MNKIAHFLSSIFYIGYFPFASGTFSSFIALLIWWFFVPNYFFIQTSIIVLTILVGTYSSYLTELEYDEKDPSFIVIDEFAGMFISLFLIPKNIVIYALGFILFRILDIIKPSYINTVQKYSNGIGVMADDILAGIISCFVLHIYINILI